MSYKNGGKNYKIYGFTNRNNIDLEYFYENPTRILLPAKESEVYFIILFINFEFIYVFILIFLECNKTIL